MTAISSTTDESWLWASAAGRKPCAHSGEMRLATAVFDDALRCVTGNIAAPAGPRWQELTEACDWIWTEGRDSLLAFDNVCGLLGLNPAAVRRRLQKVVAREARRVDSLLPTGTATVVELDDWKAMSKRLQSRRRSAGPHGAAAG